MIFLAAPSLQISSQVDERPGQLLGIDLWSHNRPDDQVSILPSDSLRRSDWHFRPADPLQGNSCCFVPQASKCPTSLLWQARTSLGDYVSVLQQLQIRQAFGWLEVIVQLPLLGRTEFSEHGRILEPKPTKPIVSTEILLGGEAGHYCSKNTPTESWQRGFASLLYTKGLL